MLCTEARGEEAAIFGAEELIVTFVWWLLEEEGVRSGCHLAQEAVETVAILPVQLER